MEAGFQRKIWANGVGDDWLQRNKSSLGNRDLASDAIKSLKEFAPKDILEVGASNGWRLQKLKDHYGCGVRGIDPSEEAIKEAANNGIAVDHGYAHDLPYPDDSFDVVIFGFCLCFISPEDWMAMVSESNRVLRNGGFIVVYDFIGTRFIKRRMMNIMADSKLEEQPVYLYNFNWPELWLSHPAYKVAVELFDMSKSEACSVMQKQLTQLIDDAIRVT